MTVLKRSHFQRRTGLAPEDLDVLARLPLFTGLSRDAIRDLLADAWVQTFPRNKVLFLQDEPALRFYVIFEGWVKLFRESEDGDESVIAVFTNGESFAEAAIFDSRNFPVSAMAVDESRLLVVPADSFIRRIREDSDYALKLMASMSRHLRRLVQQVEQLTVRSTTERLASFLIKLCPEGTGPAVVQLPLDKSLIAGRLGMQPETLSRALAKLRALGVETKGNVVTISNVESLRNLGERRPH